MTDNFWMIEVYSDETANVSVTSKAEIEALQESGDIEEWQYAPTSEASEEDMIERAEEHDLEHDPW
ncbi:MAG: hypothetical protein ABEJ07_06470 [Candidatus Nanohaloarchaea archaeon]